MSYVSQVLADSPRGYWRMNEPSGLIQDSSGNGNNSTSIGGTPGLTYSQGSPVITDPTSNSIEFSGTAFFSIPDHVTLDLGDVCTQEAWMRRDGVTGGANVALAKGLNTYSCGYLNSSTSFYSAKAGIAVLVASTATFTVNTWFHCVATKNGSTNKLYMNGIDVTGVVTNLTLADSATILAIGTDYDGTSPWFGELSEVAVYSTELTQARILAHYNAALTADTSPSDNPPIGILGRGAGW